MVQKERVVILCRENGETLNSENFADYAERVMQEYMEKNAKERSASRLTTTKLRGIYAQIMNIYTRIASPGDFQEHRGDIQYLKVKLAYESGREQAVDGFLKATQLMDALALVNDYDSFTLYCRYAESLVAFFKYYGGRD